MNAPGARSDWLHRSQVCLVSGGAQDDQVSVPDLKPKSPCDRFRIVACAQGQHKARLALPGNLEFDSRLRGNAEIARDGCTLVLRDKTPQFFMPQIRGR